MADKITMIVERILSTPVDPLPEWDSSLIHTVLQTLPEKHSERLADRVIRRSIQFGQEYGIKGDKDFEVLLDFFYTRENDLKREWKRASKTPEAKHRAYGALADTCSVLALTPDGIRIGNHVINLNTSFAKVRAQSRS